ncbi:MAG: ribonuclease Y [Thermoguttaceae bacterium]
MALLSGNGVYWTVRYLDRRRKASAEATLEVAREDAQKIVAEAKESAQKLEDAASKEAEEKRRRADIDAEDARARAKTDAEETRKRADLDAEETRKRAEVDAEETRSRANADAEARRRESELELKERAMTQQEKFENEKREAYQLISEREKQLTRRQESLDQLQKELRGAEKTIESTRLELQNEREEQRKLSDDLKEKIKEQERRLYEVAKMTREEATSVIMKRLEEELDEEEGALIMKKERQATERSEEKAREILLVALQRYSASHTAEATTNTVDIPIDDMKGRIIGREGRNIRAFEKATGVDVLIDDTPGVVIVSSFNPLRREAARIALKRLIDDGRIHPTRIEEECQKSKDEVHELVVKKGREACEEADVHGLNEKIVEYLGRLCFRTSYSQNVLRHSVEVAYISGMIAAELGLDEKLARKCGLLHDIGKALDHELEGGHPVVGADFLRRHDSEEEVVAAARYHHEDPRAASPYTTIVAAADACSASRPGARRETLENYVRRMEEIETIAKEFPNVEHAFAVQAGRELRVILNPVKTSDESAAKTCRDVAKALTERVQVAGEIRVTVIRETRTTEIARQFH